MTTGFVSLVGAGPGHPDYLTVKGARVLAAAEVIVYDALISQEFLGLSKGLMQVGAAPDLPIALVEGATFSEQHVSLSVLEAAARGALAPVTDGPGIIYVGRAIRGIRISSWPPWSSKARCASPFPPRDGHPAWPKAWRCGCEPSCPTTSSNRGQARLPMRIPVIDSKNTLLTPPQVEQWNAFVASLTGDQVPWLLGFLSAVAPSPQSAQGAAQAAGASPAAVPGGITVLFASQTGNATKIAKRLVTNLAGEGLAASAVSASDYKTGNLKNEKLLVLVCSTQGEGSVPDTAVELHRFLFGKRAPQLSGLRFAVLALGDYSYRHFCKAGADFDRRLEELGGERFLARVDCDADYRATAEAWQGDVIVALKNLAPSPATVVQVATQMAASLEESGFDKQRPFYAPVLERINLNGRGSGKTTTHIELSLAGSGIVYQPGDALGVLPRNVPGVVDELLAAARLSGDAPVSVDGQDMPLSTALVEHFEITTITRPFVKAYAQTARRPELAAFLDPENEDEFQSYVYGREIIDLMSVYPPGPMAAQEFVGMFRRLQPRLYSIASSPRAHEDEVHLLVRLTRYQSYGRTRHGVCSTYLCERLGEDEAVRVYPSPSPHFRLPANPDAPVIMIGPGTGVAPFRAFMEEREALGCRGRNWLFFGDQHFATDFLYQVEWQRWQNAGLLSCVDLAFSRDQESKLYVQHRMQEKARDLYAWLQEGAHIYVCGDATRMAAEVHATLLDIVGKQGGKEPDAAEAFLEDLQASKRYQRDVY